MGLSLSRENFRNRADPGEFTPRTIEGDSIMVDLFQPWHLLVLGIVGSGVVLVTVLPFLLFQSGLLSRGCGSGITGFRLGTEHVKC
jgi:hypothetical protein